MEQVMPAGTLVTAPIVGGALIDEYGTHFDWLGVGGWRALDSVAAMQAIPVTDRLETSYSSGMRRRSMRVFVWQDGAQQEYQLQISDADWNAAGSEAAKIALLADNNRWQPLANAGTINGGAPQWQAGKQKEGALVFDAGYVYRVKQDITNSQSAPGGNTAYYLLVGPTAATSSPVQYTYQRREFTVQNPGAQNITEAGAIRFLDIYIAEVDNSNAPTGNVSATLFPNRGFQDNAPNLVINPSYGLRAGDIISYAWFGPQKAYDTEIIILNGNTSASKYGVTLYGLPGSRIRFNRVTQAGALPAHMDLTINNAAEAQLDFESNLDGIIFEYVSANGTVYSSPNNTFSKISTTLMLS